MRTTPPPPAPRPCSNKEDSSNSYTRVETKDYQVNEVMPCDYARYRNRTAKTKSNTTQQQESCGTCCFTCACYGHWACDNTERQFENTSRIAKFFFPT